MAAGQSPLSCCMQVAGAQEPRSYSVRPWHHSLALARKVNHRLIFSHSAKKDSTQLRFLSLPAKKTVWERERIKRGGEGNSWGHLDWTSSKTQRVVFFEEKKAGRGKKKLLRLILDIKLYFGLRRVWTASNHTKSLSCFCWVIGNAFAKLQSKR